MYNKESPKPDSNDNLQNHSYSIFSTEMLLSFQENEKLSFPCRRFLHDFLR